MAKNKTKQNFFIIVFFFFCLISKAQITFNVTNTLNSGSGSLRDALTSAISSANAGNNVLISFNAPGLVQLTSFLPFITISNGSINFNKNVSATVDQGVEFAGVPTDVSFLYGFYMNNNNSSVFIRVKNLTFKGFLPPVGLDQRAAMVIQMSNNVEVSNCKMLQNTSDIICNAGENINIHDNIFTNNSGNSFQFYSSTFPTSQNLNFKQNTITGNIGSPQIVILLSDPVPGLINIENNNIITEGLYLKNYLPINLDPTTLINIEKNTFDDCHGFAISLENPLPYWRIKNNSIPNYNNIVQIFNIESLHPLPNIYGIDFIQPNSLGYPVNNTGNVFGPVSITGSRTFNTEGFFGKGVKLIGLKNLENLWFVTGYHTTIRQSEILSVYIPDLPIRLVSGGNDNILKPNLISANLIAGNIDIQYQLPGTLSSNADYVVDFYKSNTQGDVLDYMGNQVISTITGSTYSFSFPVPSGVTFNPGDRLAATSTSLGNQVFPASPKGTSEVAYIIPTNCSLCHVLDFTFSTICKNELATFTNISAPCFGTPSFQWNFGDGSPVSSTGTHTYTTLGTFNVKLFIPASPGCPEQSITKSITVSDCIQPCENCIGSFAPGAGEYILSAWVKEDINDPNILTYTQPQLFLDFPSTSVPTSTPTSPALGPFYATESIIDGWQRVEAKCSIPTSATYINIRLQCALGNCFFDDIRMFPVDGSMKSYVYDPITLRLVAELDERNYATLYEYDEEGKLIRVKKETEKGIMTIKENKNSTKKK